jgi:hypothetical protein
MVPRYRPHYFRSAHRWLWPEAWTKMIFHGFSGIAENPLLNYQDGRSFNVSYRNISLQSLLLFKPSMSTVKSFSCSPNSFTEVYCVAFAVLLPTWRRLDRCQRLFRILMCFPSPTTYFASVRSAGSGWLSSGFVPAELTIYH